MRQKIMVEFTWQDAEEDELDYLGYVDLTPIQENRVRRILALAERWGRIRPGWYVGPLGSAHIDGRQFIHDLLDDLALDIFREED